jgi:hypothetical protein
MNKYKLIALAFVFVAFEQVPAQVTFTSETKLIIVNVSVKDKSGMPVEPEEGRLRRLRGRQETGRGDLRVREAIERSVARRDRPG